MPSSPEQGEEAVRLVPIPDLELVAPPPIQRRRSNKSGFYEAVKRLIQHRRKSTEDTGLTETGCCLTSTIRSLEMHDDLFTTFLDSMLPSLEENEEGEQADVEKNTAQTPRCDYAKKILEYMSFMLYNLFGNHFQYVPEQLYPLFAIHVFYIGNLNDDEVNNFDPMIWVPETIARSRRALRRRERRLEKNDSEATDISDLRSPGLDESGGKRLRGRTISFHAMDSENHPLTDGEDQSSCVVKKKYSNGAEIINYDKNAQDIAMTTSLYILAFLIISKMREVFKDVNETEMERKHESIMAKFADNADQMIRACGKTNAEKIRILKIDYAALFNGCFVSARSSRYNLLGLVSRAKFKAFSEQGACALLTMQYWSSGHPANKFEGFFYNVVFHHWPGKKWKHLKTIVRSLRFKFFTHAISHIVYIVYFAVTMIERSMDSSKYGSGGPKEFVLEIILLAWQITFIVDMIYNAKVYTWKVWKRRNTVELYLNVINILWVFFYVMTVLFGSIPMFCKKDHKDVDYYFAEVDNLTDPSKPNIETVYVDNQGDCYWPRYVSAVFRVLFRLSMTISFIFSSIRIMRIFTTDVFKHSILRILRSMFKDLASCALVYIGIWSTYAIVKISLGRGITSYSKLPWHMFISGAYEIFGDFENDDKAGKINECEKYLANVWELRDTTVNCLYETWMLPLFLFFYALVNTVLLINIVTSFFTSTIDKIRREDYPSHDLFKAVMEYELKSVEPPPLTIIRQSWAGIMYLYRKCSTKKEKTARKRTISRTEVTPLPKKPK